MTRLWPRFSFVIQLWDVMPHGHPSPISIPDSHEAAKKVAWSLVSRIWGWRQLRLLGKYGFPDDMTWSLVDTGLSALTDPQQLDQPMQGSHPEGTDVSALHHLLCGEQTIPADKGLFLAETWRLPPAICSFTSEMFYSDRLGARTGLERQVIRSQSRVHGAGLRYLPVPTEGNQSASPEEADAIRALVGEILSGSTTWIDREGTEHPITLNDIVIIAPYNAQVYELSQRLPGARIGTVDKFQGQEAPIAIYSMTTSGPADAPRGMDFLYSPNRFNVATSRARCVSILVASPDLFEVSCRTPWQMQLANAFCRYLELAQEL